MDEIQKLRQSFLDQANKGGPQRLYDATVLAIDSEAYTCDILLNDTPRYTIRLRAVVSTNKSIDVLPAEGAAIVVGQLGDDDFIVLAADEITSYRITTGNTQLEITADGVLVKKETETLNKLLTDLVKGVLTIAAPKDVPGITLLLERINNLLI